MKTGGKGGLIIFCLIVVIAAIAAFAAYLVTGQMGIETGTDSPQVSQ